MRRTLFYIIGAPGTGKTTLMAELTQGCSVRPGGVQFGSLLITPHGREVAELGVRRTGFGGTDGLAMNVQPRLMRWMVNPGYQLVIGEGDRLGGESFLAGCLTMGWRIRLAVLSASREVLAERYGQRGSAQNEKWIQGRFTKVRNVASWATRAEIEGKEVQVQLVNGEQPVGHSAQELARRWPEVAMLR